MKNVKQKGFGLPYLLKVLFTSLLCFSAHAEVKKVNFIYLNSPEIMPLEVIRPLIRDVQKKLRKVGVRIQPKLVLMNRVHSFSFENRESAFNNVVITYKALKRKNEFTHFLTGPMYDVAGMGWLVGYASIWRDVSLSSVRLVNDLGQDRYWQSVNGVVHELGHSMLNLQHDNGSCELMNIGVLTCPNQKGMGFSAKSLRGIK